MAPQTEHLDTADEKAFRLRARDWMHGRLPPRIPDQPIMNWDDKALVALDRETQRLLWEGRLAGITVPAAYGGLGLTPRYEQIFAEEAEPYRLPWHLGNNHNIVLPTLLRHASEAQKQRYIPRMLTGEHIWCQMTSEPSGGSDLFGLLTRAEKRGDSWYLTGSKVWTTGGLDSDMGLCLARTDPSVPKHAGLTMFLVDMKADGMTTTPLMLVNRMRDFCQEYLDDVEVADDHVVGEVNGGWAVASTQLASERDAVARGWNMGIGAAAPRDHIDVSDRYAAIARALGVEADSHARRLVGEAIMLDALRDLTPQRIMRGMVAGAHSPMSGATASLISSLANNRRVAVVSELTGPAGVVSEVGGGEPRAGMDRVWLHRIGGGTMEMLRNTVSERVLGLPKEATEDRNRPFNQIRHNI